MSRPENNPLQVLPSVDAVLQELTARGLTNGVSRRLLTECVRQSIQYRRDRFSGLPDGTANPDRETLAREIATEALQAARLEAGPCYRKAINATGIILHTGLGRAVLPASAIRNAAEQLSGYSVLQVDEETGKRSRRDSRIERLVRQLTGAEAATVVNNNAAATLIVLSTVGRGREVIVSRGQLVEIGGSFRLPDVMALSGAKLVEVGTTNKTHARDYEQAINDNTAAILRVHPSNYRIEGFTAEVPLDKLVEIAHRHGLPLIDDVGAGALIDSSRFGLAADPTLSESIKTGADLVLCSTDKMIGGPQGGLILGKALLIEAIRKNPLARALRVDKVTLSLLESTLALFLDDELALEGVPTLRMMRRESAELRKIAMEMADALRQRVPEIRLEVIDGFSQMGSGSLPGQELPTSLLAIDPPGGNADQLAALLRQGSPPVFARIARDRLLIDPRTVLPGEEPALVEAIVVALTAMK